SPGKPAATTGDDVPAVSTDRAASQLVLTSLSRSADSGRGFRTNVGLYNPGSLSVHAVVSLYGPSGQLLGSTARDLAGQSSLQINAVFGACGVAGDVPNAYAIVTGTQAIPGLDRLFAYAAIVDNQSQDTTLVLGRPMLGTAAPASAPRTAPAAEL